VPVRVAMSVRRGVRLSLRMRERMRVRGVAAVFEELDLVKDVVAVERANVTRLRRREPTNRPAEVHEVRFHRMCQRVHPDLLGETVALPRVAWATSGDDVRPVVGASAGERNEVIARERLPRLQLSRVATAILAPVAISREEEGIRHLTPEPAGYVNEFRQSDDDWSGQGQPLGADDLVIRFDDFRLAVDHEAKGSSHRDHGQRLERGIQSQTANDHAKPP